MQVDSGGHKAGWFFCQFCDIENLANFSQKNSRVSQIYTRTKKRFSEFFWGKSNKTLLEKKKTGKGGPNLEYCIQQKITQTKKCQILLSQKDR
jgi:hypothetical protein